MRWCAACVVLAGCNQIFGLKPTKEFDAAVDVIPEAPLPRVQLTWQVATLKPTGEPADMVSFAPIAPTPKVRIATMDGAFADATYGADGSIDYPQAFVGAPWRLEYTLGANAPVEVQWAPPDGQGHVIVPLVGRVQRDTPPLGSGYTIAPGGVTSYTLPRVFTTGMWTETVVPTPPGGVLDTDFANAKPMSGSKGRPDSTQGDRGLLVDFTTGGGCRRAVGSADFAPDLMSTHTAATPTWATTTTRTPAINGVDLNAATRLGMELGMLYGGPPTNNDQLWGYLPALQLPGFSTQILGLILPVPVMLPMAQCSNGAVPTSNAPPYLDAKGFPRVAHAQFTNHRPADGLTLTSGIEVDALPKLPTGDVYDATFPAAIPEAFKLQTPTHQMIDLAGATEDVAVAAASGTYVLSFTPEQSFSIDYTEVTLHEINAGALMPVRTFVVTGTSVSIDGASLAAGKHYVFEVRTHVGVPGAAHGDFTQISYPQGLAIVFTRTIKT